MGKKVCVIGGNGFLGAELIKQLLLKGYAVNTTVRHKDNSKKISHLGELKSLGELEIFGANLTEEEKFDAPIAGCEFVFPVAAPTDFHSTDPEGYPVSKALAEKAAWKFAEENHFDLVTVIPSLIYGASLTKEIPSSLSLAMSLITGNEALIKGLKGMQILSGSISLIHVQDVCQAQIFLAEKQSASGRYICCSHNTSVPQLANFLNQRYPQYNIPTHQLDDCPSKAKLIISSEKLIKEGFSFKFGIEEIYDHTLEYFKTKGILKN